jgi:hypothetical protein
VQIGKQDMLSRADPPRDCLTNRSGADDDDDIFYGDFLSLICF